MTNVPPPPSPVATKKGLSTGAKIAIGCGILALLAAIVVGGALFFGAYKAKQYVEGFEKEPVATAAKTYAAIHPDIEFVEADEDSKRVTFRNTKTGEEITIDAADLESGRITFESEKGKTTVAASEDDEGGTLTMEGPEGTATFRSGEASANDLPSWVVRYPGAKLSGAFTATSNGTRSGTVTFTTGDDLEEVLGYFRDELEEAGYHIETQSLSGGGQELRMIQARDEDASRDIGVTISRVGDRTQAAVTYKGPDE